LPIALTQAFERLARSIVGLFSTFHAKERMQAKVLVSERYPHLVGLVGEIAREKEIEDIVHYHLKFKEYPGMLYHFRGYHVEIVEETDVEV
jgi:hypothetical protein